MPLYLAKALVGFLFLASTFLLVKVSPEANQNLENPVMLKHCWIFCFFRYIKTVTDEAVIKGRNVMVATMALGKTCLIIINLLFIPNALAART